MSSASVGGRDLATRSGSHLHAWTSAGRDGCRWSRDRCRWSHCRRCTPAGTVYRESGLGRAPPMVTSRRPVPGCLTQFLWELLPPLRR